MNKGQDIEEYEIKRIKLRLRDLISKQLDKEQYVPINQYEIRNYVYYGFSDKKLRPRYWKVFLDYYSINKFKTEQFYKQARQSYNDILKNGTVDEKTTTTLKIELNRTDLKPEHKEVIERILKVFIITNKGIGYVQGMINVINIFYYVLMEDDDLENTKFAEEDAFYLFNNLISEMSSLFLCEYDEQKNGIKYKVNEVFEIIKNKDPALYEIMHKKDLFRTMFPLKWILLLFSTEYEREDVIWLWDKIFSDSYRYELVLYCAASFIIMMRDVIMKEEYDKCMEVLQKPGIVSPETLFHMADLLRREEKNLNGLIKERKWNK